jgi:glutathionylspermidine synthase
MNREDITPRANVQKRLSERCYIEATVEPPYWTENACYSFSTEEIDRLEETANELQDMVIQTVGHIIDHDLFFRFGIHDQDVKNYITTTFERNDPTIYGRFDFAYDGHNVKMLEYNADTPTSLYESAVLQWDWLQDHNLPDQFNSVHERLIDAWKKANDKYGIPKPLYFAVHTDSEEDIITVEYMRDTATQAGIKTAGIGMSDIGWNGKNFTDLEKNDIKAMFKLYPWEWMINEEFGKNVLRDETGFIEPAWKMLVSNKQLAVVMHELFPDHPNLLPTYESHEKFNGQAFVKKAKLGREGQGISIIHPEFNEMAQESPYGPEGYVYQQYFELPEFDGMHPVLGIWMVDGKACGMGIREDQSRIIKNTARFVPHYFK